MLKLFAMRHAKSSWDFPDLSDHDRPLNKRGEKCAQVMGKHFAENNIAFDLVYTSSSKRTTQTLEILASITVVSEITVSNELYLCGADRILQIVRNTSAKHKNILLLNHEPTISAFVMQVCKNQKKNMLQKRESDCRHELNSDSDGFANTSTDATSTDAYAELCRKFPTAACAEIEFAFDNWSQVKARTGKLINFTKPRDLM